MQDATQAPPAQRVPIDQIEIGERLRPVSLPGVDSLISSIRDTGIMKDEIHLRQKGRGTNKHLLLMAGAHRLEAARRLGWDTIPAKVWVDVTDDFAALMEIDDNLSGSDLNPLDLAVFLAARKAVYERLHPETKQGGDRGNQHTGGRQTEQSSFCHSIAMARGVTERQIRKITAVGQALSGKDVAELRFAFKPVLMADLEVLSKITEPDDRKSAIWVFRNSTAKTLRDAIKLSKRASDETTAPPKDPVEEAFKALSTAWKRAPKAVRKRFVAAHFNELHPFIMLGEDYGADE